jgi:hypothetical protein
MRARDKEGESLTTDFTDFTDLRKVGEILPAVSFGP